MNEEIVNKINKNKSDLAERVDKLTIAILMLLTTLRSNVKVDDTKTAIASIPVINLDRIEQIIKNL